MGKPVYNHLLNSGNKIMNSFKDYILAELEGAEILAIKVLNKHGENEHWGQTDERFTTGNTFVGIVAAGGAINAVLDALDYSYDSGYGSQDCHDINIWTADKVYYIHEYDGSTSLDYQPRNPS